ncbi:MAG: hypothetical protein KatS3mg093_268 [Candidatus Parcubacteria bacterium]|nr:MAG: hypothetical protein KatS3mg093_268 [Candidatus Parcubacteria bacterium]
MSEKFKNFENENNEEFEYSEEEYQAAFFQMFLEASMNIFEIIKRNNPVFADHLQRDYDEYNQYLMEYFNQNRSIKGFESYILSKNKNNQWVNVIRGIGEMLISEENLKNEQDQKISKQSADQKIKELILKMRKGLDKQ